MIAAWTALCRIRPRPRGLYIAFPKGPGAALNRASVVHRTTSRFRIQKDAISIRVLNQARQFTHSTREFAFKLFQLIGHANGSRNRKDLFGSNPNVAFARSTAAIPTLRAFKRKSTCIPRVFCGTVAIVRFRFHGANSLIRALGLTKPKPPKPRGSLATPLGQVVTSEYTAVYAATVEIMGKEARRTNVRLVVRWFSR